MPVDLTRFDFHAMRFLNSEVVESMNSSEVGQYILLLSKAWVVGKDVSLPDDMVYLSAVAKGKISNKVLDQFPLVDTIWGARRRNQVLYAEWLAAVSRSDSASERGQKGNSVRWNVAKASQSDGSTIAERSETLSPKPNQTKSNQIKPNQIKPSQDTENFHIITIRYRAVMGRSHSKSRMFKDKYAEVCKQFGEDEVLKQFDEWAESNKWRKDNLGNTGLRFFFSDLPEMVSELQEVEKMKTSSDLLEKENAEELQKSVTEAIRIFTSQKQAELAEWKEQQKQEQAVIEELKANPNVF